jgi:hypothetical protein
LGRGCRQGIHLMYWQPHRAKTDLLVWHGFYAYSWLRWAPTHTLPRQNIEEIC